MTMQHVTARREERELNEKERKEAEDEAKKKQDAPDASETIENGTQPENWT